VARDVTAIRTRAAAAVLLTVISVGTTFAALAAGVADRPVDRSAATLMLTVKGSSAIAPVCELSSRALSGQLDVGTLDDEFVEIDPDPGVCGGTEPALIQVPRQSVAGVAITGE
jgi:hypothetical protein